MGIEQSDKITTILARARAGDRSALEEVMPIVYDELRAIARRYMRQENQGHTLQPTALVHEAFLKLADQRDAEWRNRAQFLAVAAVAIRRILVDHARTRGRAKRGGGRERVGLEPDVCPARKNEVELLELDEALDRLATLHARQAQIVELRFFGGLSMKEIAELLDVSLRTVEGDWTMAKAWLRRELQPKSPP